jgi:hypothetical protein
MCLKMKLGPIDTNPKPLKERWSPPPPLLDGVWVAIGPKSPPKLNDREPLPGLGPKYPKPSRA